MDVYWPIPSVKLFCGIIRPPDFYVVRLLYIVV
jgi:hypothetical protein